MTTDHRDNRPDYLLLGHVTRDLLPGGAFMPGGTALYSSIVARRLGLKVALVTALAEDDRVLLEPFLDDGVWVAAQDSPVSTTFRNVYDEHGHRTQMILGQAAPIEIDSVPRAWRDAPIVHLGPVAQELPVGILGSFPNCLLGVTPQGWMRSWDAEGLVSHTAWPVPLPLRHLPSNAFLVLSTEDLDNHLERVRHYMGLAPLVAITQGGGEAYVCEDGQPAMVAALDASPVDPTGAGDVFATALFIRYRETGDLAEAARFAHAAAAANIEGLGTGGIPRRDEILARLNPV